MNVTRTVDWKKQLIALVKASGQEVIDRAEDLVGEGDLLIDISIWLRFPQDGVPTVEVTREYASENSFKVYGGESK